MDRTASVVCPELEQKSAAFCRGSSLSTKVFDLDFTPMLDQPQAVETWLQLLKIRIAS